MHLSIHGNSSPQLGLIFQLQLLDNKMRMPFLQPKSLSSRLKRSDMDLKTRIAEEKRRIETFGPVDTIQWRTFGDYAEGLAEHLVNNAAQIENARVEALVGACQRIVYFLREPLKYGLPEIPDIRMTLEAALKPFEEE